MIRNRMLRSKRNVAMLLTGLFMAACVSRQAPARDSEGGVAPNWDKPLVGGVAEPSTVAAATFLPFSPKEDTSLGMPALIEVTDPNQSDTNSRAIAWVYHQSTYGTLNVIEQISQTTQQGLEGLVNNNGAPGGTATFSLVTLSSGQTAVLETGPVSNSIMWL
ncbi:MAG: hypothetical protein ACXVA6_15510 [Isosphaeraceae bacterium]